MLITVPDRTATVAAALQAAADALDAGTGPAALVSESLALPPEALTDLVEQRPGASIAATATGAAACGVHVLHHRVVDVATDVHPCPDPNAAAVGLIRLNPSDRPRAAAALRAAATEAPRRVDPDHGFAWLLVALVRAGVVLKAEPVEPWPWAWRADATPDRGRDQPGAGQLAGVGEAEARRIRLVRANRADDGVYSVAVLRRLSKPLSALGARRGWAPNAITTASLVVGLAAAGAFAVGQRWALVLGAVLLQASIVIDCSDGEVARLTGRYSTVGAWLDAATDRVKEYAAYAGLAAGAAVGGETGIWWWAGATMTLQTARHLSDYTFHAVQVRRETSDVERPLADTSPRPRRYRGIIAAASQVNRHPLLRSMKRVVFLPIGERWLIISVTAALLTPWWTFGVLLAAGILSAAYAWLGRILRTRTWPGSRVGDDLVAPQVDEGPVAQALGAGLRAALADGRSAAALLAAGLALWAAGVLLLGAGSTAAAPVLLAAAIAPVAGAASAGLRYAWAVPSALAALELATWLVGTAALQPGMAAWGFAVAAAMAFHRYDLLYRAMAGAPAPRWIRYISGGTDGRLIVMALLVAAGAAAFAVGLPWAAVVLTVTGFVVASAQWLVAASRATA